MNINNFTEVLLFLLRASISLDEGVSPTLLQLLQCALCGGTVTKAPGPTESAPTPAPPADPRTQASTSDPRIQAPTSDPRIQAPTSDPRIQARQAREKERETELVEKGTGMSSLIFGLGINLF